MTDLRTAAQQALEALELAQTDVYWELNSPTRKFLRKAEKNLRAALAETETCTWWQDGDSDSGVYQTACRKYFDITDGTPEDNKMQWCCYCGKKLVQELITEDSDE